MGKQPVQPSPHFGTVHNIIAGIGLDDPGLVDRQRRGFEFGIPVQRITYGVDREKTDQNGKQDSPASLPIPQQQIKQNVEINHQKGNKMNTTEFCRLDKKEVVVLRIAGNAPGEPAEHVLHDQVFGNPDKGNQKYRGVFASGGQGGFFEKSPP